MEERTTTKIVGTLPADGWYATYTDGQRLPLIGWLVSDAGEATGLIVDGTATLPAYALTDSPYDFVEYAR